MAINDIISTFSTPFFAFRMHFGVINPLLSSTLLTNPYYYDIMSFVYAHEHNLTEDIMDDGDGETCHCMKIIGICQA